MNLTRPLQNLKFRPIPVILLLALLQLAVSLLINGFSLSFDESIWHYIGRNWFRNGLVPYSGGVDNKSPLIFALYGISDRLFGVNYWFPKLMGTLCQSLGIYYVYRIARHAKGPRAGWIALSLYGLSLMWHSTAGKQVSLTETFEMGCIIYSFYRYFTGSKAKDYFIGGLVASLGLGFRISGFFGIMTILLVLFKKNTAHGLAYVAGLLLGSLVLAGIALGCGIPLQELITYSFTDNFGKGSATDYSFLWKLENFTDKFFYSELPLFYPFVLGYILIRRRVDTLQLWMIMAFLGISAIGIFDRAHLKELLPPFSLMAALCIDHLISHYRLPAKPLIWVLWILFFPKLLEPWVNLKKLWVNRSVQQQGDCRQPYPKPDDEAMKNLGRWVRSQTQPGDLVLVAGYGAQVQVYSERVSPSIYFNVTQTRIAKKRFFDDLGKNKLQMILIPLFKDYGLNVGPDIRSFIDSLVSGRYDSAGCQYSYSVYRLRRGIPGSPGKSTSALFSGNRPWIVNVIR
jgi:hypothetical protein